MPQGKLQVVLVSAKGLENTDFLYEQVTWILTCFLLAEPRSRKAVLHQEKDQNQNGTRISYSTSPKVLRNSH
ncbi:hypothetical protein Gohar_012065 [Gossypium harknessii]|uniref:Uncharacterized protein n=1 Tax=Gossypium harknessii TaxID=34285 RepID=A0A7J9GVV6_9ROSI|nr:hypothetical protein [Gossypium harknessii]